VRSEPIPQSVFENYYPEEFQHSVDQKCQEIEHAPMFDDWVHCV
jgi:hypothetical protein